MEQLAPISSNSDMARLEARLMHFDDEIRYLRSDLKRMEEKDRDDLSELKTLIKENNAEMKARMDALSRRVTTLERNKIWLAGWIACASLVVGIVVEICRKQLGW